MADSSKKQFSIEEERGREAAEAVIINSLTNSQDTNTGVKMPVVDDQVKVDDPANKLDNPTLGIQMDRPNSVEVLSTPSLGGAGSDNSDGGRKERQKVTVTYKNGKIQKVKPIKKKLTKEEKKKKKMEKKAKRHYWWRYILVFIAGILFPFVLIGSAVTVGITVFTTSQIVQVFGGNPDEFFTQEYQDKTFLELFTDIANGEITFDSLAGVREITPLIDTVVDELNKVLNDTIGFQFDHNELYNVKWEEMGDYIFEELQSGIQLAKVLGVNENSSSVLIYLAYNSNPDGSTNWNSPRSLGDLMNNMDSIINNAKIGDLIDVGTSGILYNLRDVKVGEMAAVMESRPLNQIIDIPSDAFPALIYIGGFPVSQLNSALDNATLKDLLPIEPGSILYELRDKKISEIPAEIENLTLGQVMDINSSSPSILQYLKDTPIKDLTSVIDTIPLDVAIEINASSPKFLRTLAARGATISNIGSLIDTLTLADMVDVEGSRILEALAGSTLQSLGHDVNQLTIADVIDCSDPSTPQFLKAISGYKITELDQAINTLKIDDIITIDESSPMILKALKGTKINDLSSKINSLAIGDLFTSSQINDCIFLKALGADTKINDFATRMNTLTFVELFADQIYENPNDPSTIKPMWRYMLKDSSGNIRTDYKISSDMNQLIENVERNIQKATLNDLYNDGFLNLDDPSILGKKLPLTSKTIGEYTMSELVAVLANFAS